FPYTTLFRSHRAQARVDHMQLTGPLGLGQLPHIGDRAGIVTLGVVAENRDLPEVDEGIAAGLRNGVDKCLGNVVNDVAAGDEFGDEAGTVVVADDIGLYISRLRSEEHTSELQSRENLVCR